MEDSDGAVRARFFPEDGVKGLIGTYRIIRSRHKVTPGTVQTGYALTEGGAGAYPRFFSRGLGASHAYVEPCITLR